MAKQVVTGEGIADNKVGQKRPFSNEWLPLARFSILAQDTKERPTNEVADMFAVRSVTTFTHDHLPVPPSATSLRPRQGQAALRAVRSAQP